MLYNKEIKRFDFQVNTHVEVHLHRGSETGVGRDCSETIAVQSLSIDN